MTTHILRYGTNAEQKFFNEISTKFDMIAVNGNILAFSPSAISKFLMMNCINSEHNFFIDPMTHAFQHSIDKIKSYSKTKNTFEIKKSIKNLLNAYGSPALEKINNNCVLTPEDFDSSNIINSFCSNVINFQLNKIKDELDKNDLLEYIAYDSDLIDNLKPSFLIPPYFYLDNSNYKEWLELNIKFISSAQTLYNPEELYAELVINKNILSNSTTLNFIANNYIDSNIRNILLWIDDFDELSADTDLLSSYATLIKLFSEKSIKVYNIYGSFFSSILCSFKNELGFSLEGVGHGLEYGEHRAVVPVGGGIPISKYYFYPLHRRLNYKTASQLLMNNNCFSENNDPSIYYDNICNCDTCHEVIKNDINNFHKFESTGFYTFISHGSEQRRPLSDQATKRICILHYQHCKFNEFVELSNCTLEELIKKLNNTYDKYIRFEEFNDTNELKYLENWSSVLKTLRGDVENE